MAASSVSEQETVSVVCVGKHGAGENSLVETLVPPSEGDNSSKNGRCFEFAPIELGEVRQRNKDILERIGKVDILVYCLSIDPDLKFKSANPSMIRSLQEVFGKDIWKQCILAFTSSNAVWNKILKRNNYSRSKAFLWYRKHLCKYANLFKKALADLGVTVNVRVVFDIDVAPRDLTTVTIPAIPVGEDLEDLDLHDAIQDTWSDVLMTEIRRKYRVLEEKRHREAYAMVIKNKVSLQIRAIKLNYIGLPRSGKTAFRRRLTREIRNLMSAIKKGEKKQPSTGVAEAGRQIFIGKETISASSTISSNFWSVPKTLKEEAGMFDQLCYEAVNSRWSMGAIPPPPTLVSSFHSPVNTVESLPRFSTSLPHTGTSSSSVNTPANSPMILSDDDIDDMSSIAEEAMEMEEWGKIMHLLDDMILLINTDTGGQAECLDLQSSLVQGPSFNLLFRRLVDKLESQFEVYFTNEEGMSTEKKSSIKTVEEVLFQTLASIACFSGVFSCDDDEDNHCSSKVLFVGTHRDMVSEETFKKRDKILQERIKKTAFYDKEIIEFASEDQLMLPVNNMSGGEDEIDMIQRVLEKIIRTSFKKIKIPASWLLLSLKIRRKKVRSMDIKECEKLARKLKINPPELMHALRFLHHHVGVLLYYPELESLKNTVICDIQIVFDTASNLIRNIYAFDRVGKKISEKFRETGQFSLERVRKATSGNTDDLIPLEKLVELLDYLGILTTIPSISGDSAPQEPTYFMPCILKSATAEELSAHSGSDSDPAPLMLRYDCGYVPVGVFPSMITNLVRGGGHWGMIEKNLRKNRVQFHVGEDYDIVTLTSHSQYFEISISQSEGSQTSIEILCPGVRRKIQSILDIVHSRMNYQFSMGYRFGFECPKHQNRKHLCMIADDRARRMKCLQDETLTVPLQPQHQRWFASEDEFEGEDTTFYCARLYRNMSFNPRSGGLAAVFGLCLDQPKYIEELDSSILKGYRGMSNKAEAVSHTLAEILSDEVVLSVANHDVWNISFDKNPSKIKKKDVDLSQHPDYTPRLAIYLTPIPGKSDVNSSLPELCIEGLDVEDCAFPLFLPPTIAPPTASLSQPDITRATQILQPYAHKWRDIGQGLGFTADELKNIECTPMLLFSAPSSYLGAMLFEWWKWTSGDARGSATIDSLRTAVDKAGLGLIAQEL